ncbi:transcription termination/antitermination protein NusG [Paramicrobacterium humi]|uniref:transcription termination/antitermination protein NusG n=1 Tax=Paramicrobacterium humi TaxID=640635 RepID=UPI000B880A15|nr:transcription termination/antitermination protein NusG [Microbacterium humi]
MSERNRDDVDWATAAEQSSEVDEAQEGNVLAGNEQSVQPAENRALHVEDLDVEGSLDAALDALGQTQDPEADSVTEEALDADTPEEIEAAAEAVEDEQDADEAAAAAEETPEPAEVDPYEAFRAELRVMPGKWYVIHSYAGFERRVKANIEQRKGTLEVEDYIYQVEVPMEDVVEIKNGQRKMVTRVRIPGYVLVRMELNEDSWSVVRHTPGVTGFVGNAHNPTPLRFEEAFNMLKSLVEIKDTAPAKSGAAGGAKGAQRSIPAEVDFEIGETITIKEGSFAGLPGSISEIKPESGKLTVLVSLFERETPVELSFDQVTKL